MSTKAWIRWLTLFFAVSMAAHELDQTRSSRFNVWRGIAFHNVVCDVARSQLLPGGMNVVDMMATTVFPRLSLNQLHGEKVFE